MAAVGIHHIALTVKRSVEKLPLRGVAKNCKPLEAPCFCLNVTGYEVRTRTKQRAA